jgi:tripartite-type tricarboxylate transporter receptor subunit TctC
MTAFTSSGSAQGHLRANRIRALGITNARRSIALPDVPTISEAGVPGYEYGGWYGLFGPRGLPAEITEGINAMAQRLMTQQPLRARLEELGGDLDLLGPAEFAATLNQENQRWARAAAEGTIRAE